MKKNALGLLIALCLLFIIGALFILPGYEHGFIQKQNTGLADKNKITKSGEGTYASTTSYARMQKRNEKHLPAPAEGIDEDELARQKWFEWMHQSAPGVNWRDVEQKNAQQKWDQFNAAQATVATNSENFANGLIQGTWTERGSTNQAGRMLNCDYDKENDKLYAISAGNSIWKGSRDGSQWQVLNDKFSFSNIIKLVPLSGTSKRMISVLNNKLVYSDNDGKTIQNAAMDYFNNWGTPIGIEMLNDASNTIYYLCRMWNITTPWGPVIMVFKSSDKGASFQRLLVLPDGPNKTFRFWKPFNQNTVYLLQQNKYIYKLAGEATSPSPVAVNGLAYPVERTSFFGFANSNSRTMYTILDGDQLYLSYDDGINWSKRATLPTKAGDCGGQISLLDSAKLLYGEVESYRSFDKGLNWTRLNSWGEYYSNVPTKLHADMQFYKYFQTTSGQEFVVISSDGGIAVSYDNGLTTNNISLLQLNNSQYYDVKTSPLNTTVIMAGSQDQGIQQSVNGNNNGPINFRQIVSGDFGKMAFTMGGTKFFSQYIDGSIFYFPDPSKGNWYTPVPKIPGSYRPNFGWLFPACENGNPNSNSIFIGGGNLSGGDGSYLIRVTITDDTNPGNIKYIASQFNYDFKANSSNGKSGISDITVSPLDSNLIYVSTADGLLFYSTDRGSNWTKSIGFNGPWPHYLNGNALLASPINKNTVYMGGSGYSNPPMYKSVDGGKTFTAISTGLPNTTVYKMVTLPDESAIFAATDAGPYAYLTAQNKWYSLVGIDVPFQSYWSVEYIPAISTVRYSTYGRGIWDFKLDVVGLSTFPGKPVISNNGITAACNGDSIKLVSSTAANYQWYKDGILIIGATGPTFYAKQSGSYTIRTSNTIGTAESNPVAITLNQVLQQPVITTSSSTTFCNGGSVVLTSSATNGNQWLLNGIAISGATNTTYMATGAGNYTVQTTNASGCPSIVSTATIVTVNALPPTPTVIAGGPTTFCDTGKVVLTSSAVTGNQWYKDTSVINTATSTTYTANQSGNYRVRVTNSSNCFSNSNPIAVAVNAIPSKPTISRNNADLVSSSATGNQWYQDASIITSANNQVYHPALSGYYKTIVTNNSCSSPFSDSYYYLVTAITNITATNPGSYKLGPNPVTEMLYIEAVNTGNKITVQLVDANGRVMLNQTFTGKTTLPVQSLTAGMYTVLLTDNRTKSQESKQIIKQ